MCVKRDLKTVYATFVFLISWNTVRFSLPSFLFQYCWNNKCYQIDIVQRFPSISIRGSLTRPDLARVTPFLSLVKWNPFSWEARAYMRRKKFRCYMHALQFQSSFEKLNFYGELVKFVISYRWLVVAWFLMEGYRYIWSDRILNCLRILDINGICMCIRYYDKSKLL